MDIQKLINVSTGLSIVIMLLISGVFLQTLRDTKSSMVKTQQIVNIKQDILQLSVLTSEFILYGEERPREQWLLTHQRLEELLGDASFNEAEEREILESIRQDNEEVGKQFFRLNEDIIPGMEKRLLVQLQVRLRAMASSALQLESGLVYKMEASQQRATSAFAVLSVVFAIIMSANYVLFRRRVLEPLASLTKSIEKISLGELDASVDSQIAERKDEMGELARAFMRTIVSLKFSMKRQSGQTAASNLGQEDVGSNGEENKSPEDSEPSSRGA